MHKAAIDATVLLNLKDECQQLREANAGLERKLDTQSRAAARDAETADRLQRSLTELQTQRAHSDSEVAAQKVRCIMLIPS